MTPKQVCKCVNQSQVTNVDLVLNSFPNTPAGEAQCKADIAKNPALCSGVVPTPPPPERKYKFDAGVEMGMGMGMGMQEPPPPPAPTPGPPPKPPQPPVPASIGRISLMKDPVAGCKCVPEKDANKAIVIASFNNMTSCEKELKGRDCKLKDKLPAPKGPAKVKDLGTFNVVNKSTVVPDADIKTAIAVVQAQIDDDFAPAWGITCKLAFSSMPPHGPFNVVIKDVSDLNGANGYHDGTGTGFVFAKSIKEGNQHGGGRWGWVATFSHEVLEMLADPATTTYSDVLNFNGVKGKALEEVGDCCRDDYVSPMNDAIPLSNFTYPNFYTQDGKGPWDFTQSTSKPLQTTGGGFISIGLLDDKGNVKSFAQWTGGKLVDDKGNEVTDTDRTGTKRKKKKNVTVDVRKRATAPPQIDKVVRRKKKLFRKRRRMGR